jgi:DNA-binding transcriptional MocR family regulator
MPEDIISLAASMPDPRLYPVSEIEELLGKQFGKMPPSHWGHIPTEGYEPLRESLGGYLAGKKITASLEETMIVSGAQQGLYLLAQTLLEPGDYVIVESPTFIGAIQAFQAAGARLLSLPASGSMPFELLEDYLIRYRPKFLYLMPTYQNPNGRIIGLEDRKKLLQLAAKHRVPIIEDDPYSELYYDQAPPPPLKAMDSYDGVIYVGTFSKSLFPGVRVGYMVASPVLIHRLALVKQYMDFHSGNMGQWLVHQLIEGGHLGSHLERVRREYGQRRDEMVKAIERYCGDGLTYKKAEGGFYLWCRINRPFLAKRLLHEGLKKGVSFLPGEAFFPTPDGEQELRLTFAIQPPNILAEGIRRLGQVMDQWEGQYKNQASTPHSTPPLI